MDPDEICGQCKFFQPKKDRDNKGECRRYAPRPSASLQIAGKGVWQEPQWPELDANCCCGEFQQK